VGGDHKPASFVTISSYLSSRKTTSCTGPVLYHSVSQHFNAPEKYNCVYFLLVLHIQSWIFLHHVHLPSEQCNVWLCKSVRRYLLHIWITHQYTWKMHLVNSIPERCVHCQS
jgi:hypothetical protein